MKPADVRRELDRLATNRAPLAARLAALESDIATALASDSYDASSVRHQRADLARLGDRVCDIDERVTALTATLPTSAAVRQAEVDLAVLHTTANETSAEFEHAARAYLVAVDAAESAARRLASLRAAAKHTIALMIDVGTAAGLSVTVPPAPALSTADAKRALLQAHIIGLCVVGEPDRVTEVNLHAAQAEYQASGAHT